MVSSPTLFPSRTHTTRGLHMKTISNIALSDVQAVYSGPEGDL
jgi:hypothetical protein